MLRGGFFVQRLLSSLGVVFAFACCGASTRAQSNTPASPDQVVQLLKVLTEAPGPPGYEEPVRKIMAEQMRPLADKISYDGLGSVIAQRWEEEMADVLEYPNADPETGWPERLPEVWSL